MKLIFFVYFLFISNDSLFANSSLDEEILISKNSFFDKFLLDQNLVLPSNKFNLLWYSEKNRLNQVNKKLEILSELGIYSKKNDKGVADFFLKLPASGITKNLIPDPRWLEVNQKYNPILHKNDRIVIHKPKEEILIFAGDHICKVPLLNEFNLINYLEYCEVPFNSSLWVIGPKGNSKSFGISKWNYNDKIPIVSGSLLITDHFELNNEFIYKKLIDWISTNFDYININYPLISRYHIKKKKVSANNFSNKTNNSLSPSSWGITGIIDAPSARFRPEGTLLLQINETHPIRRYNVIFSPFDWFEGGFRYISIQNRYYSDDQSFSGTQSYKDKNFEFKIKLLDESNFMPQLALGLRDFAGTGIFSSEYITSSKRLGDFDFTLGMGFGALSSTGNIQNPLYIFNSDFKKRPGISSILGGDFNSKTWFRGDGSIFGGLNYSLNDKFALKLDYSSNQYNEEYFKKQSILNYGLVYQPYNWFYLNAGYGSNENLNFGVSIKSNLKSQVYEQKKIDHNSGKKSDGWINNLVLKIKNSTNWEVDSIIDKNDSLVIIIGNRIKSNSFKTKLTLISEIINLEIPKKYFSFEINFLSLELKNTTFVINRKTFTIKQYLYVQNDEDRDTFYTEKSVNSLKNGNQIYKNNDIFSFKLNPSYKQTLGGPDGFILYSIGAKLKAEAKLYKDTSIIIEARKGIIDNYDKYKQVGKSNIPQVRTYLRQYSTQAGITFPTIQFLTLKKYNSLQYMLYIGAPEEMFAGYGGELFHPITDDLFISYDYNFVRQREFRQLFGLRTYNVETSHLNFYYLTPFSDLVLNYAYGKYLAGDKGYTINLFRKFNNGSKMGAFFTRTNLSFEDFGEGSFDKGVYFEIPFDNILPIYSNNFARFKWKPLSRDGGAVLNKRKIFNEMY